MIKINITKKETKKKDKETDRKKTRVEKNTDFIVKREKKMFSWKYILKIYSIT